MLVAVTLSAGAASADTPPTVGAVRFEGAAGPASALRVAVRDLVGRPADPSRIVAAVRTLEGLERGAISVRRDGGPGRTTRITFRFGAAHRRVGRVQIAVDAERPSADAASWRLLKQIQAEQGSLALIEGRPFHPYLLTVDVERVRRHYQARGHRDVQVEGRTDQRDGLVEVVLTVRPGVRRTVRAISIDGVPVDEALREGLRTEAGEDEPLVPWLLREDAERLRAALCRRGYADARVGVRHLDAEGGATDVVLFVAPGVAQRTARVDVRGPVPGGVTDDLPLEAGGPYCPDLVDAARAALSAAMRERGHPDVQVVADRRAVGSDRVAVTFTVHSRGQARVTRIFFEGNAVTAEPVMRQLLALQPGDLYRESAIDQSVQNLLRSGLFRRVEAETLPGAEPRERYLTFVVVEREAASIDLVEQSLTLHNLDLTGVTSDVDALGGGAVLRGGGQRLVLYAQPRWQGIHFFDPFLHRHVLAQGSANRRTADRGAGVSEVWFDADLGLGLKFLESRLTLLPFAHVTWSDPDGVPDGVDLAAGQRLQSGLGARARVDFNVRDDERVSYLGFELSAEGRLGFGWMGSDIDYDRVDVALAAALPLGTNARGQHYVLRLAGGYGRLGTDEPPPGQLLFTPAARGFEAVVRRSDTATGVVELGGRSAVSGTVELRIPMPYARRHAFLPFVDVATASADAADPFVAPSAAAGLAYTFSFLDERLEGFVHGALPFTGEGDPAYAGLGLDGSF